MYPNVSFTRTIFRVRRIVLQPGQRVKNPEAKGIKRGLFLSSVLNSQQRGQWWELQTCLRLSNIRHGQVAIHHKPPMPTWHDNTPSFHFLSFHLLLSGCIQVCMCVCVITSARQDPRRYHGSRNKHGAPVKVNLWKRAFCGHHFVRDSVGNRGSRDRARLSETGDRRTLVLVSKIAGHFEYHLEWKPGLTH